MALRIAFWVYLGSFVLYLAALALLGRFTAAEVFLLGVPMIAGDFLIALPLWFIWRGSERWPRVARFLLVGLSVLLISAVHSWWDNLLRTWFGNVGLSFINLWFAYVSTWLLNVAHNAMFVALLAFGSAFVTLRDKQRQLERANVAERDARGQALRLQLNPHFLFNAMNALSSLIVLKRNGEAEEMIERLSTFLRSVLLEGDDRLVPLAEEFDLLDAYLDVERVRFGERLAVEMVLPADCAEVAVPPFVLQPAVENAVKYAVAPSLTPVTVTIEARRDGDRVEVIVADNGQGAADAGGTGLGLANITNRLRLAFGDSARVEAGRVADGFRTTLAFPVTS